jgi:hypothetical protein
MRRFESRLQDAMTTTTEVHVGPGGWIRSLRRSSFEIEDLIEVHPEADAGSELPWLSAQWASAWPCE